MKRGLILLLLSFTLVACSGETETSTAESETAASLPDVPVDVIALAEKMKYDVDTLEVNEDDTGFNIRLEDHNLIANMDSAGELSGYSVTTSNPVNITLLLASLEEGPPVVTDEVTRLLSESVSTFEYNGEIEGYEVKVNYIDDAPEGFQYLAFLYAK
ncbi:hypothetical protein [Jeotgalibacillus aurantiacus]|uniref:hypothetical protein n=1 Tax=Jeotgalibacillus aurantiacus TaxID=2763266 RepID=UPI001D09A299|nr:hypothetical protein [Jeotgalibacillus aurantiacus]